MKYPVLFVGHGSPMNAIEDNRFSRQWQALSAELPRPEAILCISAHWLTRGTFVTAMEKPGTIHDFGGFPQELFDIHYPAPGNPDLAATTKGLIHSTNAVLDNEWGLDHGTWSVLKQMYPHADIPVVQISIDIHQPGSFHYALGKELAPLRDRKVLIVGSGNMVHNLGRMGLPKGVEFTSENLSLNYGYDWALEMNDMFKHLISEHDHEALVAYDTLGNNARLSIPTPDHYFPLLYALALQDPGEKVTFFNDECIAGSLSMTSIVVG